MKARKAAAASAAPSPILVAIRLPSTERSPAVSRLEGYFATSDTPRIVFEAHAMKDDDERVRAAGCEGYIGRPMRYRGLLEVTGSRPAHARA